MKKSSILSKSKRALFYYRILPCIYSREVMKEAIISSCAHLIPVSNWAKSQLTYEDGSRRI